MTPEQEELGFAFFDERCVEAENGSYWEREDLDYADEMKVMDVVRAWSVSPYDLEHHKPKEKSLGVLGSHSELLKRVAGVEFTRQVATANRRVISRVASQNHPCDRCRR